jgi:hypothetical protein
MQSAQPMGQAFTKQFASNPDEAPTPEQLLRNDPSGVTTPYASNPLLQAGVGAIADWTLPATAGLTGAAKVIPAIANSETGQTIGRGLGSLAADEAGQLRIPGSKNNLGLYSKLESIVQNKMGGSATPEQIRGMLKEVKPEEMEYSGTNDFLNGKDKVSKEDLLNNLENNQTDIRENTREGERTKYGKYTLPGGTNYQEHLYTYERPEDKPVKDLYDQSAALKQQIDEKFPESGSLSPGSPASIDWHEHMMNNPEYVAMNKKLEDLYNQANKAGKDFENSAYNSSHWDEPNTLAHMRTQNFVDDAGNKVLHAEELQSDWHQAGRQEGYSNTKSEGQVQRERMNLINHQDDLYTRRHDIDDYIEDNFPSDRPKDTISPEEQQKLNSLINEKKAIKETLDTNGTRLMAIDDHMATEGYEGGAGVPDAPLKKTWHEFLMKQLIKKGAEQDADKISWTTGAQQADRYNLADKVDEIRYFPMSNGEYHIVAMKDGQSIYNSMTKADELPGLLGKDISSKIVENKSPFPDGQIGGSLTGDDLSIGGQGMKGFYDKIIPDYLNKLGKQYGTKVESTSLSQPSKYQLLNPETGQIFLEPFDSKEQAMKYAAEYPGTQVDELPGHPVQKVHSLKLTPELKKAALEKGFPLFSVGAIGYKQSQQENTEN